MSTGGAKFHEFGPFQDASGTPYSGVKLHAYDAGGFTVPKTFWTDEPKTAPVTTATGDTSGRVSGYFDGDYAIEILQSDDSTPLAPTFRIDNINITGDFGTNYETQQGTVTPSASANNKGMLFVKFDGSSNPIALQVSKGTSFITLVELTAGGLPALDNLATKIMPVANVKHPDYGAAGDGSTDDTAAIQAAIDAIEGEGGGIVWIPEGVYKVNTTLQIGAVTGNTILTGAGKGATILKTSHISNDILQLGDGSTTRDDISVRDIAFDSSVTRTGGAAISLDKVEKTSVDSVRFINQYDNISTAASNSTIHINNLTITDTVATNGTGITLSHGNDYYIDTLVMNTSGSDPKAGIFMDNVSDVFITDTHILNSGNGIYIEPGANQTVDDIFIRDSEINSCDSNGIYINASSATACVVKTIKISGVLSKNNTLNGIRINGHASATLDDVSIDNTDCYVNANHGILLNKGINVSVNSCTCSGNDSGDTDSFDGIAVSAGVSQFELIGNKCGQVAGHSDTQNFGIRVVTGASDDYVIAHNTLLNNKNDDLVDGGTGTRKIVEPNLLEASPATVITLTAAANTLTLPTGGNDLYIYNSDTGGNIDTISGGWNGRKVTIRTNGATFRHGIDHLHLAGGADFASSAWDIIELVFDVSAWFERTRSANS